LFASSFGIKISLNPKIGVRFWFIGVRFWFGLTQEVPFVQC
jgi:hypothetical protein